MLVLSRKAGQEIVIGENIRLKINKVSGNRVTIGISAPDDVRIVRGELEPIVRSFEAVGPQCAESAKSESNSAGSFSIEVDPEVLAFQTPSAR